MLSTFCMFISIVDRRIKARFKIDAAIRNSNSVVKRRNQAGMKAPMAAMAEIIVRNQKNSSVSAVVRADD